MAEGERRTSAFSVRTAECAVAGVFFALGAIVIYDSMRLGASWAPEGPQPGYFPFYVGLIICISSAINFIAGAARRGERNPAFVDRDALKRVLVVLVPTAVFAALVAWLGIYVAGAIFIAFFMRWLGRYAWWKVALIALGTSIVFFLVFEIWFLVPLPKGPLEALLHLD